MQIFVNYKGINYEIDADPSDTIESIRQKLSELINVDLTQIILTFESVILNDDTKTLSECNINKDSTVFATLNSSDQSFNVCAAILTLLFIVVYN